MKITKQKKWLIAVSVVAIVAIVLLGGLYWFYNGPLIGVKASIAKIIPLPAAVVGTSTVSAESLAVRAELANNLYASTPGYNQRQYQNQILDRLIEAKKIELLAGERDIAVTESDISAEYQIALQAIAEGDEEKLKHELKKFYLTTEDFKQDVVKPRLAYTKLAVWFYSQKSLNEEAYRTAQTVSDQLASGAEFASLARQYSQDDATKQLGGNRGLVSLRALYPELATALKDAQANSTHIIAGRDGIYVFHVGERDSDAEDPKLKLQQIYLKAGDFSGWYRKAANDIGSRTLIQI
jgi:hypothetical protein